LTPNCQIQVYLAEAGSSGPAFFVLKKLRFICFPMPVMPAFPAGSVGKSQNSQFFPESFMEFIYGKSKELLLYWIHKKNRERMCFP